ncbi:low-density lipoprotein receptor-related protein 4-like isoform X2 [Pecten maximus]|uniref:low-density lipoprotein receptor-related protein 4-like isoform X2 n=1 Tax=Pecten maximus TaxID=6579 RepID=UPI00145836E6|nr:low-density lipoprotein receptor-related protein 4-like isoform X2 [Pecten maximus]
MFLMVMIVLSKLYLNSATDPEYYVIVYGPGANQGRVQLIFGTESFTLCGDGWDDANAAVVCRMLGYTSGAVALQNVTTANADDIWSHQFDCNGSEPSLRKCPIMAVDNVTECATRGAPGVFCSKDQVPDDFFLLSFGSSIARMDRSHESLTVIQSGGLGLVIAVDYDPIQHDILWTDIVLNQIAKCHLNGGEITIVFQAGDASVMDGFAVDSDSRLMFYTDTGYDEIGVVHMDTLTRTVLFNSSLEEPRKIIFDSNTSEIYWTDWGTNAKIERANYDGSDREVVVDSGLVWPNSLVLDGDLLYWCDGSTDVVEKIARDGTGRTVIYSTGLAHCFDFVLVDDYFYCNDWGSANIIKLGKNGSDISTYGPGLQKRYGIAHYRKGTLNKC